MNVSKVMKMMNMKKNSTAIVAGVAGIAVMAVMIPLLCKKCPEKRFIEGGREMLGAVPDLAKKYALTLATAILP